MNEILSDDEQVERIKAWWKANGNSIIAGVVIGLGGFFAWQWWGGYQDKLAGEGAEAYELFAQTAFGNDVKKTDDAMAQLQSNFGDTSYSQFAAMELARQQVSAGSLDAAEKTLDNLLKSADSALKPLLQTRLARLLVSQKRLDEAAKLLDSINSEAYAAETAAIRGEIAYQQGDMTAARAALQEAQQKGSNDEIINYLLEAIGPQESS
ncbi:MAG: tetratricopeptide repeat protein [Pseudomonadota bacterium]|nr:tetratricopeptide repeat protein [Pseudomonadota bacterium]